ncbi:MAG: hypothetical protein EXR98_03975 [Gemmataceae bacterium]|nr:hypothetical protein [Gemmataceae bacterium]
MSKRASAMIWLVLALIFGFITLTILCGGGYYFWHTHSKVQAIEKRISDAEDERKKLDKLGKTKPLTIEEQTKRNEANKVIENIAPESNQAQKERAYSLFGLTFIIPGLMTVAFGIMFLVKFLKARAAEKKAAEADEEEEEEEVPVKKKPKKKATTEGDDA